MKQNDTMNPNIKVTNNENLIINDQIDKNVSKDSIQDNDNDRMRKSLIGSNVSYSPADFIPSQCNPNNGAFFEERSNPLSSKGN